MVEAPIGVNIDDHTKRKVKEAKRLIGQVLDHRASYGVQEKAR